MNMMSVDKMNYWYLSMRCLGMLMYVAHTWLGLDYVLSAKISFVLDGDIFSCVHIS